MTNSLETKWIEEVDKNTEGVRLNLLEKPLKFVCKISSLN